MPAVHAIADLQKRVSKQSDAALAAGDAFFYPSSRTVVPDESTGSTIDFVITCVPALAQKAKEKEAREEESAAQEEQPKQNPRDVFAPPYVPNLLVKELDDFTVLLNKFAVLPRHFLLVTREFAPQDLPPSPRMLALAYRILLAYSSSRSSELMAFYNCGPHSGASQPHQHVQFIAVGKPPKEKGKGGEGAEEEEEEDDEVDDLEERPNVPIEALLDRIERDGKEEEHIHAMPVPWQHFVRLISPPKVPTSSSTPKETQEAKLAALEGYMASRLLSLIDAQFQSRRVAAEEQEAQQGGNEAPRSNKPSFNLLLTRRAFHLIPRKQGDITIPLKVGADQTTTTDVSVNSLGYAGLLLARSEEEVEAIRTVEGGVIGILTKAGREPVPDDSWSTA
ncbi:bifunctional AP-4-A phosphorylase/ADP sulfurylase [Tilletia horrida]|nr:bifunctional AP-4-A phosphorylase/ADP sulfurylase [Tilletia horrida]